MNGTHKAPSIKVAEASKIIENSQRDVNIAFMNELAKIFNAMGIDTEDVIEAASLVIIEKLLEAGATVKVYDPVAMSECKRRIGDTVTYCKDMYEAVIDADALALITEWKSFRMPSWSALKKLMRYSVIVDGRNIYDKKEVLAEGFTYYAIGK